MNPLEAMLVLSLISALEGQALLCHTVQRLKLSLEKCTWLKRGS